MVGGPNGAGKSTYTTAHYRNRHPTIDPDEIARADGLDDTSAWAEANRRARSFLNARESFVIESTLAGRDPDRPSTYIAMMHEARALGYRVDFVFIALDAPAMHVLRVADRVRRGGHDIPTELVTARYWVSTGVRLGQGYDAADGFVLLNASAAGSFRILVVAEHGEASYLSATVPEWADRGLGTRLDLLRSRDQQRVLERARASVRDPQRMGCTVTTGIVRGQVVATGAGHVALALDDNDERLGLPEGSIVLVPATCPSETVLERWVRYDVDRRLPQLGNEAIERSSAD